MNANTLKFASPDGVATWRLPAIAHGRLQHLPIHLVAIGGADLRTCARHGYFGAMKTQIDQGIFDYCGAPVLTSGLFLESEQGRAHLLDHAQAIGHGLFASTAARFAA